MTGRAKWDAWAQAGKDYTGRAGDAEERYLEIARGMGWVAGEVPNSENNGKGKEVADGEESSRGDGTGMGISVSKMAVEGGEESASELHRLAVEDDAFGLLNYIDATPELDVNAKDEFVRSLVIISQHGTVAHWTALLQGYTALHLAADRGNAAAVKALLAKGADRSLQDEDEFTALELARVAGHEDVVALLEK